MAVFLPRTVKPFNLRGGKSLLESFVVKKIANNRNKPPSCFPPLLFPKGIPSFSSILEHKNYFPTNSYLSDEFLVPLTKNRLLHIKSATKNP